MSYDTRPGGSGGGGAGDTVVLYEPDAPPASANANDDEFNDLIIGGAWAEYDPGAVMVQTEDVYGLKHVNVGSGAGHHIGATYRAFPSGSWSITAKVDMNAQVDANFTEAGIFVAEDLSGGSTTANFYTMHILQNGAGLAIRVTTWSGYDTPTADRAIFSWVGGTYGYLRFVYTSGTDSISAFASSDGIGWDLVDLPVVLTALANPIAAGTRHVGVFTDVVTAGLTMEARYRFFRVVTNGIGYDPLLGKRVTYGVGAAGADGKAGLSQILMLPAEDPDEPLMIPGPSGPPSTVAGPAGSTVVGPPIYLEAEVLEPDIVIPGPAGPASTVAGPPGSTVTGPAVYLEADLIEPEWFPVPGRPGDKGDPGTPGSSSGGSAPMPLGVQADELFDEPLFVPHQQVAATAAAVASSTKLFEFFALV